MPCSKSPDIPTDRCSAFLRLVLCRGGGFATDGSRRCAVSRQRYVTCWISTQSAGLRDTFSASNCLSSMPCLRPWAFGCCAVPIPAQLYSCSGPVPGVNTNKNRTPIMPEMHEIDYKIFGDDM